MPLYNVLPDNSQEIEKLRESVRLLEKKYKNSFKAIILNLLPALAILLTSSFVWNSITSFINALAGIMTYIPSQYIGLWNQATPDAKLATINQILFTSLGVIGTLAYQQIVKRLNKKFNKPQS